MKKILALFLSLLLTAVFFTSCGEAPKNQENNQSSTVQEKESETDRGENENSKNIIDLSKSGYEVTVMYDHDLSTSLEDMIKKSDYVLVATAKINSFMGLNRNTVFSVEEVLKGEITAQTIEVSSAYFNIENVNDYYGNVLFRNPLYVEPEINNTYLLFVNKESSLNREFYSPSTTPFMVKIEKGHLKLELPEIMTQGYVRLKAVSDTNKLVEYTYMFGVYTDNISSKSLKEVRTLIK